MRYDDDQCERCGGVRVAKSTLCADCLVALCAVEKREREAAEGVNRELCYNISNQAAVIDDLLKYGFKQNQKIVQLLRYIKELEKEIASEGTAGNEEVER